MSTLLISSCCEHTADVIRRIYDRLIHQFGRETVFKDADSISPVTISGCIRTNKWRMQRVPVVI